MNKIYAVSIICLPIFYALFVGDSVINAAGFGTVCGAIGAAFWMMEDEEGENGNQNDR